jgi:hypothetical protein
MRLMCVFSLAAALMLGGMVGACQPTKPCHCVQSGGCRCPLPPPPKNASPSKEQPGRTQTATATHAARHAHEAQREYAASGHEERLAHRHRHLTRRREAGIEPAGSAEEHESPVARHGRHFRRTHGTPSSRSGGALSYDYRTARSRFAIDAPERGDFEEDHFPYRAHHYAERDYEGRRFRPARMSINSQEALEPWRGYRVACPGRDGRE